MGKRTILHSQEKTQVVEFVLNKGEFVPPHNHPGAYVFCYMVRGRCQVKSYQLLEKKEDHLLIQLTKNLIIEAGESCSLTPFDRNIHSIQALEDSVFLDVFNCEIDCRYYSDIDWLELTKASHTDDKFIAKVVSCAEVAIPYEM